MIKVEVVRTVSERVAGGYHSLIQCSGHASRDDSDLDGQRVCAAISTLTVTLVALSTNELINLDSGDFKWEGEESPHIEFFMKAVTLLASSYPQYLSLSIR